MPSPGTAIPKLSQPQPHSLARLYALERELSNRGFGSSDYARFDGVMNLSRFVVPVALD